MREMTAEDFSDMYAVLADSDIMQHYPYTFDKNRVKNWIACNVERYAKHGFGLWAVCLHNGKMIGDCGLTMQNIDGELLPEIGYHIAKAYQRQGYAKEAASAVKDWTFQNTAFNVVYSYMKATNLPSIATAKAVGMSFVKKFDDGCGETFVFCTTRKQWEQEING